MAVNITAQMTKDKYNIPYKPHTYYYSQENNDRTDSNTGYMAGTYWKLDVFLILCQSKQIHFFPKDQSKKNKVGLLGKKMVVLVMSQKEQHHREEQFIQRDQYLQK